MTTFIIKPLKPMNLSAWKVWPVMGPIAHEDVALERWYSPRLNIQVMSGVEVTAQGPGHPAEPHYHISISHPPPEGSHGQPCARCDSNMALEVLRQFGAEGFLEDNHVAGGKVRNFWRPVADKDVGKECKCVEDEPAIREDKGDFIWRAP